MIENNLCLNFSKEIKKADDMIKEACQKYHSIICYSGWLAYNSSTPEKALNILEEKALNKTRDFGYDVSPIPNLLS